MRQILILCAFVFSCSIYADNKNQRDISVVDFNENEYRIIAKIISMLDFDINNDKQRIQKLQLPERFIWNAFIWRFYVGNKRNNELYFTKLHGVDFQEITSSSHKKLLHFFQKNIPSDLVLEEYLSMVPPPKYFYSKKDLIWVENVFLKTQYIPLRNTSFYILLMTQQISSKSNKKILESLSKKERSMLTAFEERKYKKNQAKQTEH